MSMMKGHPKAPAMISGVMTHIRYGCAPRVSALPPPGELGRIENPALLSADTERNSDCHTASSVVKSATDRMRRKISAAPTR